MVLFKLVLFELKFIAEFSAQCLMFLDSNIYSGLIRNHSQFYLHQRLWPKLFKLYPKIRLNIKFNESQNYQKTKHISMYSIIVVCVNETSIVLACILREKRSQVIYFIVATVDQLVQNDILCIFIEETLQPKY